MQIGVETSKAVDQRRVFVIDHDEVTRAALQFMLHDEIETHELASLEEAYEKGTDWLKPDVMLLGVSFLKEKGVELVAELKAKFPRVRILIVCEKSDETTAVDGMKAGRPWRACQAADHRGRTEESGHDPWPWRRSSAYPARLAVRESRRSLMVRNPADILRGDTIGGHRLF